MSIPDKVKVGGMTYKVVYTNEPNESIPSADGSIAFHKLEIRLRPDMPKEYTEVIFLHELIHAIVNCCYIDLGEDDDEITERLAQILYQVFKDNDINFKE